MKKTFKYVSKGAILMMVILGLGFSTTSCVKKALDTVANAVTKPTAGTITASADATNKLKVSFTSTSLFATKYSWDFGDSTTKDTTESPTHTYAKAGTYTVTLEVSNSNGDKATATKSVTVG